MSKENMCHRFVIYKCGCCTIQSQQKECKHFRYPNGMNPDPKMTYICADFGGENICLSKEAKNDR